MLTKNRRAFLKGFSAAIAGTGLALLSHSVNSSVKQVDKQKKKDMEAPPDLFDPLVKGNWWV